MVVQKEGQDRVVSGFEQGIAPSPLFGIANVQNANISTQGGEALASYGRLAQQQAAISGGTLTASVSDGATLLAAPASLMAGTWIRVTASTITSITAATSPSSVSVNYLLVAGGGGGGGCNGSGGAAGGGGAGAMLTGSSALAVGEYSVTVGDGGAGAIATSLLQGTSGSDTVLETVATATGGGGGGAGRDGLPTGSYDGLNGGSGGGGGADEGTDAGTGGTGTTGGNNGGNARSTATCAGGGGGGAGAVGANAPSSGTGGAGGNGTASSISGASVTYAGGGGGGANTSGDGGTGGGGRGGNGSDGSDGVDGTDGLGGGGGGAGAGVGAGGDGGKGIVIISYPTGSVFATGGDVSIVGANTIHTFRDDGLFEVISIPTGGLYYVSYKDANNKVKLSAKYDPTGANAITHGTSGTATFDTVAVPGSGIAKAVEKYTNATSQEYRYYVLDANGYVWVYDTAIYDSSLLASGVGTLWMLPDPTNYSSLGLTGLAVLNGWLMALSNESIFAKQTVRLGFMFRAMDGVYLNEPFPTHTNFAMVGSQGKMYYCDGNYLGEVFPTTSLATTVQNVQSYAKYTGISSTRAEITFLVGGSLPFAPGTVPATSEDYGVRIPVVFFTDEYGTLPTAVTEGVVYYIAYYPESKNFRVYSELTGGSVINTQSGASGNQYFNTFYPIGSEAGVGGETPLLQWTGQRMNLPFYETAQSLVEIGNQVLVGCAGNVVYPWNQVDALPSDLIALPEANVKTMINVNNMAYIFAGSKGNIYITNGSVASLALKVPDYCAGVPGTPLTYIEPYFTWGDAGYVRGRVYFSILDQTATKAGNCGGVWSFIPSQNVDPMQNVGMALRLENQNSYGSYNGVASIILPNEEQQGAVAPLYWTFWQTSYSLGTSTFGIDQTAATPVTQFVVETDLVATGTSLDKETLSQLEYKVANQLQSGDAVQLYYRLNGTDAWTSCGTVSEESANRLSGYFRVNFQKTQWLQLRAVCTTGGTTASSFVRLTQLRIR